MKLVFDNFNQLEQMYPELSKRLRDCVAREDNWLNEEITVIPLNEYAENELETLKFDSPFSHMDDGLYPNPFEYIDVEKFANALADTLHESDYHYYDEPTQLVLFVDHSW